MLSQYVTNQGNSPIFPSTDDDMPDLESIPQQERHSSHSADHSGHSHQHSHHCKHHHDDNGDGHTKRTKWIEATTALVVYTYVYGMAIDNCIGNDDEVGAFTPISSIGISWPSLIFSILIAGWASWGSANSHEHLNAKNEGFREENEENEITVDSPDISSANETKTPSLKLSRTQIAALIGDFIGHSGEVIAPITLVIDNVTQKYNLSPWAIRGWQGATIAFSMLGSVANVRACKNSMLEEQHSAVQINKADLLTWLGLLAEGVSIGLGNADWIAATITDCANSTKQVFEVSWEGFGIGVGVSALTVVASSYLHTLTNINYQTTLQPSKTQVEATPLTTFQLIAQPFDYLTHIGAYTPRIDFFVERLTKGLTNNKIPLGAKIATHAVSLAIGSVGAYADWRACKNNAKKYNFNNKSVLFQPGEQELVAYRAKPQDLTESLLSPSEKENIHVSRSLSF